jgi:PAS domain S-box-containing protein
LKPVDMADGHICEEVIRGGPNRPWVIRHLPRTAYAQTDPNVMRYGLETYVGFPVTCGGVNVGSLCALYHQDFVPGEDEVNFLGIVAAAIGVEEARHRADETRRETEERFRLMVEAMPLPMVLTRVTDRTVRYANQRAAALFGVPPEAAVGRQAPDYYVNPEESDAFVAELQRTGFVRDKEVLLRRHNGGQFWAQMTAAITWFKDERVILVGVRDITDQKQAAQALRQSVSLLRSTLESTCDGLLVVDAAGRIVDFNQRFAELWRLPQAILDSGEDQQALDFVLDQLKDPQGFLAKVRQFYDQPEADGFDILEFKDGRVFERYSQPQRIEGRPVGRVWSFRDVTERQRAEAQLARSREQLRALVARVQETREEERSRIAREIHDVLGQLLTGLKMDLAWCDRRLAEVADAALRQALAEKIAAAERLADTMVETVQKITSELRPSILDNIGLPAALQFEARQFHKRTGIRCEAVALPETCRLDADAATGIFRVFQEILTNVARHAQATRVEIRFTQTEDETVLTVSDDGRGIDAAAVADPNSLGLQSMRERALLLGGHVEIRGASGSGTTVTLTVPVRTALAD